MQLCRCSYLILGILRSRNATDTIHGLTVNEIQALERISKPSTIYKKIKKMESLGFVKEGLRAGKAKTYFLTDVGICELPIKKEGAKV